MQEIHLRAKNEIKIKKHFTISLKNTIILLQNITKHYKTRRTQEMTNEEIIQNAKKSLGMGEFEPLHTFQKWKEMGFKVKKGEHAVTCTKLWKPKAKKFTDENGEEKVENNFFLTKAYLFKLNQVERITPTN